MRYLIILLTIIMVLTGSIAFGGQFSSGSTGADGVFNPTLINTEVQLPPDGVLNYTTVNIPQSVTVTFKKNSSNTPVYILATGDVTIAGTVEISGTNAANITPGLGGAGGFDGGWGGGATQTGGKGLGPGGGNPGLVFTGGCGIYGTGGGGGGAGYSTSGNAGAGGYGGTGGGTYGNERILPLIGGSGGGGGGACSGASAVGVGGGGGGGAILIASSGTITITGSIKANGGKGGDAGGTTGGSGGNGSGGAIKLAANTLTLNGTLSAAALTGGNSTPAGTGRIRLEAYTVTKTTPTTPAYTFGFPGPVFVANIPSLQITSIAGVNVPSNPAGSYATPDITLPSTTTNPVAVALAASNIPVGTTVTISSIVQFGSATNVNTTLSGTTAASTGTANVNLSNQYPYILTATATFTIQTAMYFDGERIEKVRVAATIGKGSDVTYITESGKEVPAEKLFAGLIAK